ncbi:hypothetical protein [Amycolatopsis sp. cg13]|uniref:hypothetical protein n=1 Tax=Amycolatopsis sp. cg13 TaxID=3238807 RepID=UPI003524DBD2
MKTLRRRILATAVLPAAALGILLAAPGAASASTAASHPAARQATVAADHQHHRYGLDLSILLGLHLSLGGHYHHCDCWHGGLLGLG